MRLKIRRDPESGIQALVTPEGEMLEGQMVLTEHTDLNKEGVQAWVTVTFLASQLDHEEVTE